MGDEIIISDVEFTPSCCPTYTIQIPNYIEFSTATFSCLAAFYNGQGSLSIGPTVFSFLDLSGSTFVIAIGNLQTVPGNTNVLNIYFFECTGILSSLSLYDKDNSTCSGDNGSCDTTCTCKSGCTTFSNLDLGTRSYYKFTYNSTSKSWT
jgi:hypothetical protein